MNETTLTDLSDALADAVSSVEPGIVTVQSPRTQISGLVYASDLVLTVAHVLDQAETVQIQTFNGRTLGAEVVGQDPQTDLALLHVADLNLTPVKIASRKARVGELVLMVARAVSGTMASHGIVSVNHGLRFGRGVTLESVVRTDAMPFPGCSGGAILNAGGEVLGVTNAGMVRGVGLGIPAQLAWATAAKIRQGKVGRRGYLGLAGQPVRLAKSEQKTGLLVIRVETDSPAEHAGILVGDILLSINDHKLEDAGDLLEGLNSVAVGQSLTAKMLRGGKPETLQVTVGEPPTRQNEQSDGRGRERGHTRGGRGR